MALVIIHAPRLTADQKKRIGDRLFEVLHSEGIPASSTILLFKKEDADILLDGGLLVEAEDMEGGEPSIERLQAPAGPLGGVDACPDARTRARRSKNQISELKEQLVASLQKHGHLSSFQAQELLGLKDCDGAPATLRKLFSELEEAGLIAKQGQKRGTRYVWNGITSQPVATQAILVKRDADEDEFAV